MDDHYLRPAQISLSNYAKPSRRTWFISNIFDQVCKIANIHLTGGIRPDKNKVSSLTHVMRWQSPAVRI